jgi:hypothetical protein
MVENCSKYGAASLFPIINASSLSQEATLDLVGFWIFEEEVVNDP